MGQNGPKWPKMMFFSQASELFRFFLTNHTQSNQYLNGCAYQEHTGGKTGQKQAKNGPKMGQNGQNLYL